MIAGNVFGLSVMVMGAASLRIAWMLQRQRAERLPAGGPDDHLIRNGRDGLPPHRDPARRLLHAFGGRIHRDDPLAMQRLRMLMTDRDFDSNDYEMLLALDEDTPTKMLQAATAGEISRLPVYSYRGSAVRGARASDTSSSSSSSSSLSSSSSSSSSAADSSCRCSDAEDSDDPRVKCHVCLEPFVVGESLKLLPCFHQFHADCIDRWLVERAVCPVCKTSIRSDVDATV